MHENPYQSPQVPTEPEAVRSAKRWVAAPSIGIWIGGAACLGCGVVLAGAIPFLVARVIYRTLMAGRGFNFPPHDLPIGMFGFFAMGAAYTLVGWLSMRYAKQLRELNSDRGAHLACILALIMYPMCVVTLPLGVYGLIVLRRTDVQAVLKRHTSIANTTPAPPMP